MRCALCLLLFLSLPGLAADAQTYTVGRVQFDTRGTFTQGQLEDAAGLHVGSKLTSATLADSAKHLVDTGYFDDVGATLDGRTAAVTVKFSLKPTPLDHMLHVGFANFVWLSHEEIEAALHRKLLLFNDYLPENSANQEVVKASLTAALQAKSIAAEVACEDFEPTLQHPRREIACRVAQPSIQVGNIKLSGVTPALAPLLQRSVNATAHTAYTEGPAGLTTAESVLMPLRDAGYVEAQLVGAMATPAPAHDGVVPVVLSATLQPGAIYRLSQLSFAGTPLLSAEAFAAGARLHAGDVASRRLLLETLAPLDAAYRRKGYMDVVTNAQPTLDPATHQVSYSVTVEPGEPYRVHEVTAEPLDAAARADFNRGFLLKPGDLYNPEYVTGFLTNNSALKGLAAYSATFKAYADPNTHLVDLVISFVRTAR